MLSTTQKKRCKYMIMDIIAHSFRSARLHYLNKPLQHNFHCKAVRIISHFKSQPFSPTISFLFFSIKSKVQLIKVQLRWQMTFEYSVTLQKLLKNVDGEHKRYLKGSTKKKGKSQASLLILFQT